MASTAFLNLSLVSFFLLTHVFFFFFLSPSTNSIFLFFSLLSAYFFFRSGGIWVILDVNFGQYHIISSVLQVQHELSWCINSLGVLGALGAVPRAKLGSWARLVTNKYWTWTWGSTLTLREPALTKIIDSEDTKRFFAIRDPEAEFIDCMRLTAADARASSVVNESHGSRYVFFFLQLYKFESEIYIPIQYQIPHAQLAIHWTKYVVSSTRTLGIWALKYRSCLPISQARLPFEIFYKTFSSTRCWGTKRIWDFSRGIT